MTNDLTTGQIAKLCGVSTRMVQKWFDKMGLVGYRLPNGRYRRVQKKELIRFLNANGFPLGAMDEHRKVLVLAPVDLCEKIGRILPDQDFQLRPTFSLFFAGVWFEREAPDLMIVDFSMGRSEIIDFVKEISQDVCCKKPSVVGLAYEDESHSESLKISGFSEILIKPWCLQKISDFCYGISR